MMPRRQLPPGMGNNMPDPQTLIKQAHKSGVLTGFCLGLGVGVVLIEVIVHLFPF